MSSAPITVASGLTCLPLEVKVTKSFWDVDHLWLGLGFLIGFIVGALLAILFGKIYIPYLASYRDKKNKDAEAGDTVKKNESITKSGAKHQDGNDDGDEKPKLKKRKKRKTKTAEPGMTLEVLELINDGEGSEEGDIKGVADALVKNNEDEMNAELTSQDLDSFRKLEKDMKDEEITSFLMLMRSLLAQAMMKGGLSDKRCQEYLKNFQDSVITAKQQAQQEKDEAEQELKNNSKLAKDPVALETEIQKLHPKYIARMDELIEEARDNFLEDLKKEGFSEDEIEALLNEHKRCMHELDRKLGEESLRHAAILEEKLARRRLLSQVHKAEKDEERANVTTRRDMYENVLQQLVKDDKMLERQKDDLLNQHEENLQKLQALHEEDRQRQELILADKLKKKREAQTKKLKNKQQKEKENFLKKADKMVGGDDLIDAYHDLLQQQRLEQEALEEMLDNMDLEEMGKLQQDLRGQREKQMNKEETRFQENLEIKAQLSERDIERIIALHNQEKAEYNRTKSKEKKISQMKLQERIAERKRKAEEERQNLTMAQATLTSQQEASIKRVLDTQRDLEEDAKKRILEEHEKSMQKVNAQLTMSQMRQQKELEQKLAQRRAKVAKLHEEAEKIKNNNTTEKNAEKRQQQIQHQIQQEEQDMEQQRQVALENLRKRLAEETQMALAEQEKEIGVLIAKLKVGAVRRKDIIEKQGKTIKDLEEQMAKKIENEDVENRDVDYLLQQHDANIANLEQQMQQSKQHNEQLLAEKLQQKKLRKEREIVEKIENEAVQELDDQRQRGAGVASNLMVQVMMEQRHKRALEDLEREMRVEMNRQREEISQELQKELDQELQEQKKNFLSQLAAVSNMSKDDVNDLVINAVSETGGDEKQAKKLAKDLRIGLKRAKTDLGLDEDDDQPQRDLGRTRTSMGYENAGYEDSDPRSKKLRRPPRRAFED